MSIHVIMEKAKNEEVNLDLKCPDRKIKLGTYLPVEIKSVVIEAYV